jgi:glycosyltransferase involved in cell wall biosynthesis
MTGNTEGVLLWDSPEAHNLEQRAPPAAGEARSAVVQPPRSQAQEPRIGQALAHGLRRAAGAEAGRLLVDTRPAHMRLLCAITAYPPSTGGAQLHCHALLTHLTRTTPEVVSFWDRNRSDWLMGTTLRAPGHGFSYAVDGVQVHRMGTSPRERARAIPAVAGYYAAMGWASAHLAEPLARRLEPRARDSDVVHCVRVGREPLALASAAAARRADRPFVLTPLHHPTWSGWRHRVYLDLYRRADQLIALTEAERRTLIDLGARAEAVAVTGIGPVLAPCARPERFRDEHRIAGPMVLFLGQHFRYKGFTAVLEAAPAVWRRAPDTTFVFAGPAVRWSERVFRGADPRIRRLGTVDLQTKTDALAASDIVCVPSTRESFGGVFTEAWSLGRPVVGGDIPAVSDVIDDGVDGFLVDQQPAEIAERLSWLIERPDEAARMGEAGRRKVAARYSWPALAAATERIYAALV